MCPDTSALTTDCVYPSQHSNPDNIKGLVSKKLINLSSGKWHFKIARKLHFKILRNVHLCTLTSKSLIINRVALAKQGDNALGRVRLSVRPCVYVFVLDPFFGQHYFAFKCLCSFPDRWEVGTWSTLHLASNTLLYAYITLPFGMLQLHFLAIWAPEHHFRKLEAERSMVPSITLHGDLGTWTPLPKSGSVFERTDFLP